MVACGGSPNTSEVVSGALYGAALSSATIKTLS